MWDLPEPGIEPVSPALESGSFVTTDEPTLTHHNHPKSTVYIRVHSWCCTFYRFWWMYNDMYPKSHFKKLFLAITKHTDFHTLLCFYGIFLVVFLRGKIIFILLKGSICSLTPTSPPPPSQPPCSYTTSLKTLPFSTFFYNPPFPCLSPTPDCKVSFEVWCPEYP